jgi:putative aldouronate transport system permease protein
MVDSGLSRRVFRFCNTLFFIFYSLICLLPILYVLSMSLSSNIAIAAGRLVLWPVDFTLRSYQYVMQKPEFWSGLRVSLVRVLIGVTVNMILIIFAAFPLSKTKQEFSGKNFFVWFFIITMLFSGGIISTYMIVRYTRLLNSIWSLILPGAVPVFNVILLMNFFKTIPRELEESAFMDGAGYFTILFRIYVPVSLAAIATLIVFSMVAHWNSWFDGMIYMTDARKYPLQTYLQSILVTNTARQASRSQAELMRIISDRTVKAAQVFIAMIPVLVLYPFLQRYFVSGITLGSIKE